MEQKKVDSLAQAVLEKIFVPLEASGRHVHVTKEQAIALFGHDLTPARELPNRGNTLQRRCHSDGTQGRISKCGSAGAGTKGRAGGDLFDGRTDFGHYTAGAALR